MLRLEVLGIDLLGIISCDFYVDLLYLFYWWDDFVDGGGGVGIVGVLLWLR